MAWFYALEATGRQGPVTNTEFEALARAGTIGEKTLVWREGMPDWQMLRDVRPDLLEAPAPGERVSISGATLSPAQKDFAVQRMREGDAAPQAEGYHQYGGFWWRFLARFIDGIIIGVAGCIITFPILFIAAGGSAFVESMDPESGELASVIPQLIGNLLSLAVGAFYYIWMTGKYGATLGKMACSLRVVDVEGNPVTYMRSFGRWAGDQILSNFIYMFFLIGAIVLAIALTVGLGSFSPERMETMGGVAVFAIMASIFVGLAIGSFPWWMCAFDEEKRTLYDRLAGTRVVKLR